MMPGLRRHHSPDSVPGGATVTPLRSVLATETGPAHRQSESARFWEAIFVQQGRTLSDPGTAETHRITAATFGLLFEGARTEGVLTDQAAAYLSSLAEAAVRAPDR